MNKLLHVYHEHLRALDLLLKYKKINMTGFTKIVKKFDKNLIDASLNISDATFRKLKREYFIHSDKIKFLKKKSEHDCIKHLFDGKRKLGMQKVDLTY